MKRKEKILFIAPVFMGYYKEIKKEFENKGYEVDYFCDSSSNSNIYKALSRINKNIIKSSMNTYFKKNILPKIIDEKYDYVFFIAGMTFSYSEEMIKIMKKNQSLAKFILYQWDGEANLPFVKNIHKYFDKIFTFDRLDALKNSIYKFLPLFYVDEYKNICLKKQYKYDVSYVGTAHPKKLFWINKMSNELKNILPNQYIYHYLPSKLKYFYHKLKNNEYKGFKMKDFHYEKLLKNEIIKIFEDSKCIFDAPQDGQNGLTMRTLECLGAKRKIITQNKDIINYDFYYPENILVYDENINFENAFFKSDYKELPKDIYDKYSLDGWIDVILEK